MIIDLARNKAEFEEVARKFIKRDGLEGVLKWLDKSDFYTAPASTQYHLAVEGGLCQHSLNVFNQMVALCKFHYEKETVDETTVFNGDTIEADGAFTMENIAVVALFHDVCKVHCYVRDFKNVKVQGKWEQVEYWKWDEQFVFGHGAKSVYMLQQFMRLFIDEAQAIRFHMGGREDPLTDSYERGYAPVFDKSPFAVLLHLADKMSAFLIENE